MNATVTVGVCQLRADVGTGAFDPRPSNLARGIAAIRRVAARGAEVATFGECYVTGYRTDDHLAAYALTTDAPDPFVDELAAVALELGMHIVIGSATRRRSGSAVYNSALIFGPKGLLGVYDKVHLGKLTLPNGKSFDETRYFTPGTTIPVFATSCGTFGVQICRDNRYPEVSRVQTMKGANLIINVTAPDPGFMAFWEAATFVRAVENQIPYVMSAVVGQQADDVYAGSSRIIAADGTILARASRDQEEEIVATIDFEHTARTRQAGQVLEHRAPQAYAAITGHAEPSA